MTELHPGHHQAFASDRAETFDQIAQGPLSVVVGSVGGKAALPSHVGMPLEVIGQGTGLVDRSREPTTETSSGTRIPISESARKASSPAIPSQHRNAVTTRGENSLAIKRTRFFSFTDQNVRRLVALCSSRKSLEEASSRAVSETPKEKLPQEAKARKLPVLEPHCQSRFLLAKSW